MEATRKLAPHLIVPDSLRESGTAPTQGATIYGRFYTLPWATE